jgi:hypothetical protein
MELKSTTVERRDIRATRSMRLLIVVEWAIVPFSIGKQCSNPWNATHICGIQGENRLICNRRVLLPNAMSLSN